MSCEYYSKNLSTDRKIILDKDQLPGVGTQSNVKLFFFFHEQYDGVTLLETIEQN